MLWKKSCSVHARIAVGIAALVLLLAGEACAVLIEEQNKTFSGSNDNSTYSVQQIADGATSPILLPNPYFLNTYEKVGYSYTPFGDIYEVRVGKGVRNIGGAGLVFVSVVWESKGLNNSKVFYMGEGETVNVTAHFSAVLTGFFYEKFNWTVRQALPGDTSHGKIEVSPRANISYVDDDYTDDPQNHKWNTIMKGIDDTKEGGTVYVYDGTYYENIDAYRKLTLKGSGMPIINARGNGSPIKVSADGVTIDGFYFTGSGNEYSNAGISIQSNNNVIVNNTATNNFKGIYLTTNSNNTIVSNNLSFNRNTNVSDGIYIEGSYNSIINNTVIGNRDEGIQLIAGSANNTVIGNTVSSNGNSNNNTGIDVSDSSNNLLYHNNLIDNSINGRDNGNNSWNFGTEGNYWSDYSGIDSNNDGIGETPYFIPGGNNKDNYPLIKLNGWLSPTPTPTPTPTSTLTAGVLNSMYTTSTPVIDGTLSTGEWSNKISITLNGYNNPFSTKSGDLYIMNDNSSIYVAVVIPDTMQDADYLMLDFDNGNDHIASTGGEDAAGLNVANLYGGTLGYLDYYWDGNWWAEDSTRHGAGAMTYSSGAYTYEFSKPLNSGDSQDMVLPLGNLVGFRIETRDGTLNDWYRYPVNTVDADTSVWNKWIDLKIAPASIPTPTPTVTVPTSTSPPTVGGKGDVNGDGQVTVVDALFVSQYTVGLRTLNSQQLAAADVNGDGQVTIVDALFIAQYTVGLRQL